jgi:HK97 family phage major capsid protein
VTAADKQLNDGLRSFAAHREAARKFHRGAIGDVDPHLCFADWLFKVSQNDAAGVAKAYGRWLPDGARSGADSDLGCRAKSALSSGQDGALGGYLVPQNLYDDLMASVAEQSVVRRRAKVVPMKSATLLLPLPDATTAQAAGTAPYFGGMLLSWTQEAATRGETEPKFRLVELRAWELSGYLLLSNPLAQDGDGLDAWLRGLVAEAVAYYEDYSFLRGSGVGQPKGVLNADGATAVTRHTSGHFDSTDVGTMPRALLPASWQRAVWLTHTTGWTEFPALANGLWQANQPIREGDHAAHFIINGQSGYTTDKLPALGTKGDFMLVDFALYVVGDRRAVELSVSDHEPTAFLKNQQAWRVVHRVDGQPMFPKALTTTDGSTTVSPYVILT